MSLNRLFYEIDDDKPNINLSPMIDMVFLLLLFFVVTTSFDKAEAIPIQKAEAKTASNIKKEKLKILLDSSGVFWLVDEALSLEVLLPRVKDWTASFPEGVVLVIPDKRAQMDPFIKLMDELKGVNITNLAIGTDKRGPLTNP